MWKELCQVQLPVLFLVYFMMQLIAKIKQNSLKGPPVSNKMEIMKKEAATE